MLECIELSSVVDFSMGAIDLMAGYMTFGHGPLHVPWAYWQLKLVRESSCSLVQPRGSQSARTQVRARGDILPNGARPQLSKAVVVYGRVGAGIKGVQPPSCVCQPEREECTAQRVHQLCLPGLLETLEQRLSPAPNNCRRCQLLLAAVSDWARWWGPQAGVKRARALAISAHAWPRDRILVGLVGGSW